MHKFFTSLYDASVYLQQPEQNAGRDEVLEVGKLYYGSTKDIYRTLIKFDITELSASVAELQAISSSILQSDSASVSNISSSWYTATSASLYWSSSYSSSLSTTSSLSSSYSASWSQFDISSSILSASYDTQFTTLTSNISNGNYIFSSYKTYLNLKSANAEEIPLEYTIYANAVSQSWTMGTGTKFDNISTDGVSWKYRDGVNTWQDNVVGGTAIYATGTTGSANAEGGTWYTISEASQSFNYEPDDVRMDTTGIVKQWISGSIPNNGFIVHHSLTNESDTSDYGVLKFFSKETNTIYQPKLEIVWNDFVFSTGSLTPVTGSTEDDYKVVLTNLKTKYPKDTLIKIRIKGRDMFPLKTFGTEFEYDQSKYLPSTTYYQIEDYKTGDIILPYGDYTKVSCDSTSNYFLVDLYNFAPNRTYKLKVKVVQDGISTIIDNKHIFEIV